MLYQLSYASMQQASPVTLIPFFFSGTIIEVTIAVIEAQAQDLSQFMRQYEIANNQGPQRDETSGTSNIVTIPRFQHHICEGVCLHELALCIVFCVPN